MERRSAPLLSILSSHQATSACAVPAAVMFTCAESARWVNKLERAAVQVSACSL